MKRTQRHRFNRQWQATGTWRRVLFTILVVLPSLVAARYMLQVLPEHGEDPLEVVIGIIFGILFAWICAGFWTALVGFLVLTGDRDRYAISNSIGPFFGLPPDARTAVLMPVCNEDAASVFARMRATYESLQRGSHFANFDFFVLSDSTDPDCWVAEEIEWARTCEALGAQGRLFYRHRRVNLRRKSGNISDFCRRWGRKYRYMLVLDADSVMAGATIARMVAILEANRDVGILQSLPRAVNGETLLARLQQFTNCVYGPVFAAGLNFWQLGDAHYWGHNCLIRIDPFMRHCALPRLPGRPPLGGEILSHDFVEAFLMRRAGWKVWLAYDLPGSYEQTPPTLIDELARDRRWCQGNLQHTRILTAAGMVPFQRYLFVNGIMSYITPALWAALLLLGSLEVFIQMRRVPVYFPAAANLFPAWPVNHPDIAARLLLGTCVVLFMPRILGIARVLLRQTQAGHGGALRLAASAFLEALSSMIFAPIRMAFHTKFAVLTLMGRTVRWDAQRRDHDGTSFREALRMHGAGSLIGLAWGIFAYRSNAAYFLWLTPVIGGLLLSIPASIFSSRRRSGQAAQRCGLFLIPEERQPPRELCWAAFLPPAPARPIDQVEGFVRAAVDPRINALHAAVVGDRPPRPSASAARAAARALAEGPQSLSRQEKMQLLGDPGRLRELHRGLWTADEALAPAWPLSALAQNAPPSSAQPGLASQARSGTGVSG